MFGRYAAAEELRAGLASSQSDLDAAMESVKRGAVWAPAVLPVSVREPASHALHVAWVAAPSSHLPGAHAEQLVAALPAPVFVFEPALQVWQSASESCEAGSVAVSALNRPATQAVQVDWPATCW